MIVLETQKEYKLRQKEDLINDWDHYIDQIEFYMEKLRELYEELLDQKE